MATYYCDYKDGADAAPGDGSYTHPYQTLTKALSVCNNGDIVKLRGSSADKTTWYREIGMSTSKTNITIEADTWHTPVIVGSHEYTIWAATGGTTNVYETAFTAANCWAVWNGTTRLVSKASVVLCDATSNSFFFDDAGNTLYVNVGGGVPTSIEVYDYYNDYALTVSGAGGALHGLTFWYEMQAVNMSGGTTTVNDCDFALWSGYSINAAFSQLLLNNATHSVVNCRFDDAIYMNNCCIRVSSNASAVTVDRCELSGGSRGILLSYGTGHVIQDSLVYGSGVAGIESSGAVSVTITRTTVHDCASSQIASSSSGTLTVVDCEIFNTPVNTAYGIEVSNGTVMISGCTIYECGEDGIVLYNAPTVYDISTTTIRNCGHGGIVLTGTGVVHHCRIWLDRATSYSITGKNYGIVIHPDNVSTQIYHCVVHNLNLSTLLSKIAYYWDNSGTIVIKNCIATACGVGFLQTVGETPTLTNDYNDVHDCATDYTNCVAGAHDIAADPLFVNAAGADFALLKGSACIDAGIVIAGINDGYLGAAPDIGAFEYEGRVKTLTTTGAG